MNAQSKIPIRGSIEPYELALQHALAEGEKLGEQKNADTFRLAEMLLRALSPARRALYVGRVERLRPAPVRGKEIFNNVIELLRTGPNWTAPEIKVALDRRGVRSEPKQIWNVLEYLSRNGQLRRVSRGQYYVVGYGVGIETSDQLMEDGE